MSGKCREPSNRAVTKSPLGVRGFPLATTNIRASDISRKKKQNFAGFSGVNSRKNRPISRDFRGKKVKIR